VWLDAGCGKRLLEEDMDSLENWLITQCNTIVGMDLAVTSNRNIKTLAQGSLYHLPFADSSVDLVTCRMVVEHLDDPTSAFLEIHRCLRPNGAIVVITPNLRNYGIFGYALATKLLQKNWRLKLAQSAGIRSQEDAFPVRYRANTMPRLVQLLEKSGLQVHRQIGLRQLQPYWKKSASLEKTLMKLAPPYALMVCAHKPAAKPLAPLGPKLVRSYEGSTT
jgi:2-polyprenyl-3-methyl-5-hydroxy-6-metoxy-1,4-benzoquinol methylase